MRAHVREKTCLAERFAGVYIADMYLYDGHLALFYRIAQRHTCVAVSARVEDYPLNIICSLYPVYQVSLVVALAVRKMDIRPDSLDLQQNLCHRL